MEFALNRNLKIWSKQLPERSLAGSQVPAWEPYLASSCLAVLREAGALKTPFPSESVTAIKLSTNGVQGLPCEVPNYL